MKPTTKITILTAALLAAFSLQAQTGRTADVQFKTAEHKEQVEGDLKGAIEQYRQIAQSKDRAIAVQALIRMAECYQKLGNAESRKIYEQVVKDFADQKDAVALARARLGGVSRSAAGKGDRAIWSGGFVDGFGTISRDGRFMTYTDWTKGAVLMLRDLDNGTDRPLTRADSRATGSGAQYSVISRDGKLVVYEWWNRGQATEVRLASLEVSGIPDYRQILQRDDLQSIAVMDWSPDGKWIAARLVLA